MCLPHRDVVLKTPYDVEEDERTLHFTYLDTVGRPVIQFRKNNLVEEHIEDFEVCSCDKVFILILLHNNIPVTLCVSNATAVARTATCGRRSLAFLLPDNYHCPFGFLNNQGATVE